MRIDTPYDEGCGEAWLRGNLHTRTTVSNYGAVQPTRDGSTARFSLIEDLRHGPDHTCVRVECVGGTGEMAWTQPPFLE
jgi:hypothetical protein